MATDHFGAPVTRIGAGPQAEAAVPTLGSGLAAASIWTTRAPEAWPKPPSPMSYTVLRDIETCPLRWALRRGYYPGLWSGVGYPSAPPLATVAGQVVHGALERIVRQVGHTPHPNTPSPELTPASDALDSLQRVITALRALGGITAVLESVLTEIVQTWVGNPRLTPRVLEWEAELRRQLPALRQRVQQLMAQVDIGRASLASEVLEADGAGSAIATPRSRPPRVPVRALLPGVYAEIALNNPELDWYGKADVLRIPAPHSAGPSGPQPRGGCEIIDFKTGVAKEEHALQLRIYALLWARESRLNPSGRPATQLTLVYRSGSVAVVPPASGDELDALEAEVRARSLGAREAVATHPPLPRPSRTACEWCDVRQMCAAYWAPATRMTMSDAPGSPATQLTPAVDSDVVTDVELAILSSQGPWSWLARVTALGALTAQIPLGSRLLVRARAHDPHFGRLLGVGARVRVVGARHFAPSEESGGLSVIALTRSTEAFLLPSEGTDHDTP